MMSEEILEESCDCSLSEKEDEDSYHDDVTDHVNGKVCKERRKKKEIQKYDDLDHGVTGAKYISKDKTHYPLMSLPYGECLIFDCTKFGEKVEKKEQVEENIMLAKNSFSALGFACKVWHECGVQFIVDKINSVPRKKKNAESSAFCCVILAHGHGPDLRAYDEQCIKIRQLCLPFACASSEKKPNYFIGKPKLFFVQVYDDHVGTVDSKDANDTLSIGTDHSYTLPSFADFCFSFSTPPGFFSLHLPVGHDSIYIQQLCSVLKEHVTPNGDVELQELFRILAQRVFQHFSQNAANEAYQLPVYMTTLTRQLFFKQQTAPLARIDSKDDIDI